MKKIVIYRTNGESGQKEESIEIIAIKTFSQCGVNREHVTVFTSYSNFGYVVDFVDKDPAGPSGDPIAFYDAEIERYSTIRIVRALRERDKMSEREICEWAKRFGLCVALDRSDPADPTTEKAVVYPRYLKLNSRG